MNELQLQSKIFQYHWNFRPSERGLLFHVNNKARNAIEGAKFKAIGVIAGVSDLIYLKPNQSPVLIELKVEAGVQSDVQKKWQQQVLKAGYRYEICRSLEDFIKILE